MIKLVSQFDNEKMRASVATPTCGPCCCCCCCCIVTAITTTVITSRNFGKIVEESDEYKYNESSEIRNDIRFIAKLIGFLLIPTFILFLISIYVFAGGNIDGLSEGNLFITISIISTFALLASLVILLPFVIMKYEGVRMRLIVTAIIAMIAFALFAVAEGYIWLISLFGI